MTLESTDLALYTSLGCANILFSGLVVLTFLHSKELRQHPSGLIVCLSICEIIMSFHSIIFVWDTESVISIYQLLPGLADHLGYTIGHQTISLILCGINQVMLSIGIVGSLCYNIAICLDLIVTLYNPFISGQKRKKFYHIATFLTTAYFVSYVNWENQFISRCIAENKDRLEIAVSGAIEILLVVFFGIGLISVIYAAWRFTRGLKMITDHSRQYLIRHILYVSAFILLWMWPTLSYFSKKSNDVNFDIDTVALVAYLSSGFFLGIIRTCDPLFWKKIKKCAIFKREEIDMTADDAWNLPIAAVVFGKLNIELAYCIFSSLHGLFMRRKYSKTQFTDGNPYLKVEKHKLFHYLKDTAKIWGIADSKLPQVVIKEFAPDIFEDIREIYNLSYEDALMSLDPYENKENMFKVDESSGKSGSFFLFTSDNRLSIKTIKRKEKKTMRKILKDYHIHLKNNPHSMLCRIYGLYTIKVPGVTSLDIILMQNVLYGVEPLFTFDIKGSTVGRTACDKGKPSGPLKDLDLIKFKHIFELSEDDKIRIVDIIVNDSKFLYSHKLMDYSLLLAICKNCDESSARYIQSLDPKYIYTMGIIDFLTEFNYWKYMELAYKAVIHGRRRAGQISVATPRNYVNRFVYFIFSVVVQLAQKSSSFNIDWNSSGAR
ncbi:unnamed protein product [Blepharisma stoltei]|uniref:PIPK domain-containing protein n=1 Tax=Blepharisma stoltei TaxID=1481888 RepID=A0AAU9K489_9CILI|nr:unnamed protein product [Blepharisma stoltei]